MSLQTAPSLWLQELFAGCRFFLTVETGSSENRTWGSCYISWSPLYPCCTCSDSPETCGHTTWVPLAPLFSIISAELSALFQPSQYQTQLWNTLWITCGLSVGVQTGACEQVITFMTHRPQIAVQPAGVLIHKEGKFLRWKQQKGDNWPMTLHNFNLYKIPTYTE